MLLGNKLVTVSWKINSNTVDLSTDSTHPTGMRTTMAIYSEITTAKESAIIACVWQENREQRSEKASHKKWSEEKKRYWLYCNWRLMVFGSCRSVTQKQVL
jgi:hypothetical protein